MQKKVSRLFFVFSGREGRQISGVLVKTTVRARILPTHTTALFDAAVARAAALLRAGQLVALPAETVYGLARHARGARGVAKIFAVKSRAPRNPIIVHVAGVEMARRCVKTWPSQADQLARAFWPGPLTLVLRRSGEIPDIVTAGGPTVGVRWPSHPFAQAVIRACGFPLAAPSANLSTRISPTTARHVLKDLGDRIDLIVDGGPSQVGLESTVLDLTVRPARVLRPGIIHAESLSAVIGKVRSAQRATRGAAPVRSPGRLPKHYSPKAPLKILSWIDDADLRRQLSALGCPPAAVHVIAHARVPSAEGLGCVRLIPRGPEADARNQPDTAEQLGKA